MYIELYLPKSLYSEVLRRARADLRAAVEARDQHFNGLKALDKEIARLNRLVKDALCYLNETESQDDLFFPPCHPAPKETAFLGFQLEARRCQPVEPAPDQAIDGHHRRGHEDGGGE